MKQYSFFKKIQAHLGRKVIDFYARNFDDEDLQELEDSKIIFGKDSFKKAKVLVFLSNVYCNKKEFNKAEQYAHRALEIQKNILTKDKTQEVLFLLNLMVVYDRKKEFEKAEQYAKKALVVREKILGEKHPDTVRLLIDIGILNLKQGNFDEANSYYKEAESLIKSDTILNLYDDLLETLSKNQDALQEVQRLTQENLEMKAALYQADRLAYLGRMATMMAHNIKNPVNNITTATVSMLMGIKNKGITAEQLIPSLERILNNSDRLNKIIENFRNFAQGDRTTLTPINLNETIEAIFQLLFVGQYQNHQIKLIKAFAEFPVMAKTNNFAIQEILVTLLNNAKEVLSNKESNQVTINTWQNGDKAGFDIEDNGGGITEEKRDKLFSPFFSSKNSGMGLGLYFCKEILKDLDGNIEYYPAPHGAGFRVTLPIATELENGT